MNTKYSKTNRLQEPSNTKQINRARNIRIKVWKYKAVERLVLAVFASTCLYKINTTLF